MTNEHVLAGRVALVTGVSRHAGIAAAVARRLGALGATVFATGWPAHDVDMPWGPGTEPELAFEIHRHDLEDPVVPAALVDEVVATHRRIDIVVAVHARSSHGGLADVDAVELDRCWAVNVRSVVLLAQRFADVHRPASEGRPTGRMLWFTSGQHLGPMSGEVAYAVSKGALHQMLTSLAPALAASRIIANCINPGPVDTGWADGEMQSFLAARFPDGRMGRPDDIADVVEFLVSDAGAWVRGQVLNAEGGFDRFG